VTVVDTSAIVAVLWSEPEADAFWHVLHAATPARMSVGTYIEARLVLEGGRRGGMEGVLDELVEALEIALEPVTLEQGRIAADAHRRFGRGSGHPARLNVGDCFSYALAKTAGEPLLFKGDDFGLTDIVPAIPAAG
jgi:ribonuclease VapC